MRMRCSGLMLGIMGIAPCCFGHSIPPGATFRIAQGMFLDDASVRSEAVVATGNLPGPATGSVFLHIRRLGGTDILRTVQSSVAPDGSFRLIWDERDAQGRWIGRDVVRYDLECTPFGFEPARLITAMAVAYPMSDGNRARATIAYTLLRDASIEFWLERGDGTSGWRVNEVSPQPMGGLALQRASVIPLVDARGNLLPLGRYRLTMLARSGSMSDSRRQEVQFEAIPMQAGLAGGATRPGSSGNWPQSAVSSSRGSAAAGGPMATGESGIGSSGGGNSSDQGNNGVRDHGVGEGRDGHGQGPGRGNGPAR